METAGAEAGWAWSSFKFVVYGEYVPMFRSKGLGAGLSYHLNPASSMLQPFLCTRLGWQLNRASFSGGDADVYSLSAGAGVNLKIWKGFHLSSQFMVAGSKIYERNATSPVLLGSGFYHMQYLFGAGYEIPL